MKIKNNKNIELEQLEKQLNRALPDYEYQINGNALTVGNPQKDKKGEPKESTKINIVKVDDEFWIVEAVPFMFKLVMVTVLITLFAYVVQMQGWHWGVNVGLYVIAFVVLGYFVNWFYGLIYAKDFKTFKPEVIAKLKSIVE